MSEDNIKSRYESNEHNGYDAPVEVFEYVETVTLKKGDGSWHWASSSSDNADKYVVSDEKGNAYTYFAIEKTPDNYVTTYRYDSAESAKLTDKKTETITNRQINLQGTKEWDDEENIQNRPDSLTIHLYKVTYDKADNTEKSATEISPLNVDWVKDENTDTWTYTIKNLTKLVETDTERQVYRVVEDVPSGYTAEVSSVEGSAVSNNTITLGALKNKLSMGSLKVTKTIQSTSGETMEQTPTYPITVKVTLDGTEYYVQDTNGTLGTEAPETSLTVTAGTELTINNLPYGSYTVAETGPDSVVITDYSYVIVDGTSKSADTVVLRAVEGQASLVNVYTKGTSWTPGVNKLLNEQAYTGNDFSFTITETTSGASYTETVNSVTSGAIAFTAIPYRAADAGKDFTYAITEVKGNDQNVAYDTATIYAKVSVRNNEGTLSATAEYYHDAACTEEWTAPAFNNTDLGSLTVTKTVSGDYTATDTDAYPITVKKGEAFVTGTVNGTTITYTGLSDTDPQYTVKAGDANKLTFVNLPVGEYVVTEGSISNNGYIITTTYKVNGTDATTASAAVTKGTATAVDITNHYRNAKLNILKVEKDSDTPLQDAEFTLYKIDETSSSLNEDKTTERKVTTNGQGQASFELLSIGYYVIRETNPPTGYVITGENSFYIEVTDTGINLLTKGEDAPNTWAKDATSYGNVKTFTVAADSSAQATVENVPGAALPSTGGHGTNLIYLLGIMLTGLAGAGLLIRQRRKTV
jgi:pilin isopeptide linkage protein/LPXTG-motif cell wall-anchored protein